MASSTEGTRDCARGRGGAPPTRAALVVCPAKHGRSLVVGDLAKLSFVVDPPVGSVEVERMWVEVLEAGEVGYVGRLDNDPGYGRNLKADDRVRFGPEHVAARWAGEADPDPSSFRPFAHAELFERFRVLDSGFEGPVGTTMKWDDEEVEFVVVGTRPV